MPLWLLLAAGLAADTAHSFQIPVARAESLHVVVFGQGEPAVIIPGFFGSAFGFRKLVPLLEQAGVELQRSLGSFAVDSVPGGGNTKPRWRPSVLR